MGTDRLMMVEKYAPLLQEFGKELARHADFFVQLNRSPVAAYGSCTVGEYSFLRDIYFGESTRFGIGVGERMVARVDLCLPDLAYLTALSINHPQDIEYKKRRLLRRMNQIVLSVGGPINFDEQPSIHDLAHVLYHYSLPVVPREEHSAPWNWMWQDERNGPCYDDTRPRLIYQRTLLLPPIESEDNEEALVIVQDVISKAVDAGHYGGFFVDTQQIPAVGVFVEMAIGETTDWAYDFIQWADDQALTFLYKKSRRDIDRIWRGLFSKANRVRSRLQGDKRDLEAALAEIHRMDSGQNL